MSRTLFKADMRSNAVLFVIILYVMMLYFSVMAMMFNPSDTSAWTSMLELLPEGLMAGFGFDSVSTNLTNYLAEYYYGFIVFIFPMIYCIIISNKLVAKLVDNGSFAYLLMAPVSRRRIIVTKGVFLLSSIAMLFTILHVAGSMVCRMMFGDMLNQQLFLQINLNAALITMLVGMICFFYSCFFNESKRALAFSAGVNIGFLLLFVLGGTSEQAEFLKDFSIYSLLDTKRILEGSGTAGLDGMLIGAVLVLFGCSVRVFEKKNLPI
ncbi:MAG: ABC transporter permease subunit [Lachnospiraceae bacterium]|nr:ABC transporter permease subunit [Lachnospiraceae bacterium]